jgi:hypothetical protein
LKYLAEETQLEKVIQELTASKNNGPMSETFCQVQSKCFNQIQLIQTSKFWWIWINIWLLEAWLRLCKPQPSVSISILLCWILICSQWTCKLCSQIFSIISDVNYQLSMGKSYHFVSCNLWSSI